MSELDDLFFIDENTAAQPTFCWDEFNQIDFYIDDAVKKNSEFLYPRDKDELVLNTNLQPKNFYWNNIKGCWSNLTIDHAANRLELRPVTPWQLLQDADFDKFLTDNSKRMLIVIRIGFEIMFSTLPSETYSDLEETILRLTNHHIYDTAMIVDVHDFYDDMRSINHYFVTKSKDQEDGNTVLYWRHTSF